MSTVSDPRPRTATSLVVACIGGLAFVVLAAVLVPWHWLPGHHVEAVSARSVFTAAQIARDEHVSWMLRLTGWGNLAIGLAVALWLGVTRRGAALVGRLPGPWWLVTVLGCGAVTLIGTVLEMPLAARAQHVEVDQGLSTQGWAGWAQDQVTSFGVDWVFTAIALVVVLALVRRAPRTWPVWAAGAAAVLAFLGSFVYPVAVEPLFNHFTPMQAGPLRTEIFQLAEAEHVHVDDVLVADASRRTTTLNAYVSGFGSTRRVVVYDTVLKQLDDAEIRSIVAHELAHAKHDDVLVGTVLGALGSVFGVGLLGLLLSSGGLLRRAGVSGPGDPRVVPLLLALVAAGSLLASPVENTISRAVEAHADRTALEVTRDPATFVEMQRRLALSSLSDPTPPRISQFWFGTHPTVLQRIGMAREMYPGE
ncbi:MAG: M48 family metallopeptidase [Marmoricola sp.]